MDMTETVALFKCLADKSRLEIIRSLARGPMYVEQLAERLGLAPSTVSFHLKKLEGSGLVGARKEQYYMVYSLDETRLRRPVLELIGEPEGSLPERREQEYRQRVIQSFFRQGKLETIPVQQKKRRIILEELLKMFEPGRLYPEKEVNLKIADFHDDFCTLRRELIAEELMERKDNVYWVKNSSNK